MYNSGSKSDLTEEEEEEEDIYSIFEATWPRVQACKNDIVRMDRNRQCN